MTHPTTSKHPANRDLQSQSSIQKHEKSNTKNRHTHLKSLQSHTQQKSTPNKNQHPTEISTQQKSMSPSLHSIIIDMCITANTS
jgi:hypothetical protein